MERISFEKFYKMMSYNLSHINNNDIEILFYIEDDPVYTECWLGKKNDIETGLTSYWYGLLADGSAGYEYKSIDEFIQAKIFNDKSIKEIWKSVLIISLNGGFPEEMLSRYLENENIQEPKKEKLDHSNLTGYISRARKQSQSEYVPEEKRRFLVEFCDWAILELNKKFSIEIGADEELLDALVARANLSNNSAFREVEKLLRTFFTDIYKH